jgi:hypothetical protein
MKHATHANLAIGWLVKWWDDFTGLNFSDWLASQYRAKPKRISDLDFALVSCALSPFDLSATEALAWTEGFVTAIPLLPATPDSGLLTKKDT